jgi:hypothetical protein
MDHEWQFIGEVVGPGWAVWCPKCGSVGYMEEPPDGEVTEIERPTMPKGIDTCSLNEKGNGK